MNLRDIKNIVDNYTNTVLNEEDLEIFSASLREITDIQNELELKDKATIEGNDIDGYTLDISGIVKENIRESKAEVVEDKEDYKSNKQKEIMDIDALDIFNIRDSLIKLDFEKFDDLTDTYILNRDKLSIEQKAEIVKAIQKEDRDKIKEILGMKIIKENINSKLYHYSNTLYNVGDEITKSGNLSPEIITAYKNEIGLDADKLVYMLDHKDEEYADTYKYCYEVFASSTRKAKMDYSPIMCQDYLDRVNKMFEPNKVAESFAKLYNGFKDSNILSILGLPDSDKEEFIADKGVKVVAVEDTNANIDESIKEGMSESLFTVISRYIDKNNIHSFSMKTDFEPMVDYINDNYFGARVDDIKSVLKDVERAGYVILTDSIDEAYREPVDDKVYNMWMSGDDGINESVDSNKETTSQLIVILSNQLSEASHTLDQIEMNFEELGIHSSDIQPYFGNYLAQFAELEDVDPYNMSCATLKDRLAEADINESVEGKTCKNHINSLARLLKRDFGKGKATHEGNFRFTFKTDKGKTYDVVTSPVDNKDGEDAKKIKVDKVLDITKESK